MAAVLHDVVEDTEITLHIHWSETASKIKIAEIEDNLDIMRVKKMSFRTYSTEKRAEMALAILRGENVKNDYK